MSPKKNKIIGSSNLKLLEIIKRANVPEPPEEGKVGKFKRSGHLTDQLLKYNYSKDRQLSLFNHLQGTELEFVIMVIAVSCVKLLSAHNSTQHTSRKHKV
jgi:hypothetical protein